MIVEKAFLIDRSEADRLIGPAGRSFTPTMPEAAASVAG
jgi:hypothetical protein